MERSRDFLTGAVFFGLLLVLGIFTIFLADIRLGAAVKMTIVFPAVAGLEEGNEVRVDGLRMGKVTAIERREDGIHVTVTLLEDPGLHRVPEEDRVRRFTIAASSLLGGRVLRIESGDRSLGKLDLAARHEGRVAPDAIARAGELVEKLEGVVDGFEAGEGLGPILFGATEWMKVRGSLTNIESATGRIDAATARLESPDNIVGRLLTDEALAARLGTMIERLEAVTGRIESGEGLLGQLLAENSDLEREVDGAVADLRKLLKGVDEKAQAVLDDLKGLTTGVAGEGGLGTALLGPAAWEKLDRALASLERSGQSIERAARNIESASGRLEDPNNLVGVLLTDEQLPEKLKRSMQALNDLLESSRESAPFTTFAGFLLKPF